MRGRHYANTKGPPLPTRLLHTSHNKTIWLLFIRWLRRGRPTGCNDISHWSRWRGTKTENENRSAGARPHRAPPPPSAAARGPTSITSAGPATRSRRPKSYAPRRCNRTPPIHHSIAWPSEAKWKLFPQQRLTGFDCFPPLHNIIHPRTWIPFGGVHYIRSRLLSILFSILLASSWKLDENIPPPLILGRIAFNLSAGFIGFDRTRSNQLTKAHCVSQQVLLYLQIKRKIPPTRLLFNLASNFENAFGILTRLSHFKNISLGLGTTYPDFIESYRD